MKKILLSLFVISSAAMSAEVVDRSFEECTQTCSVYSYTFSADFFGQCQQLETCTVFKWDEENAQCVVKERGVKRSFAIQCRDIPAY